MKKSELKLLIKEVVNAINEMVGEKPEVGQFRWNYEISITIKNADGTTYNRVDTSKWWPIIAETEQEAKEKAVAPYNPRTVTVQKVRMIKGKAIDQSDIEQWKKLSAGIAHELRPKSQGGWGANESVIKETTAASPSTEQKQFADDIYQKMSARMRKKGSSDLTWPEAVRDMISFKLAKEGWAKTENKTPLKFELPKSTIKGNPGDPKNWP